MPANTPTGLRVVDNSTAITYDFPIYLNPKSQTREISWEIHAHQVGSDIRLQPNRTYSFRVPLFPLTGGLYVDRIGDRKADTYAKANGDARYDNLFVPPPAHTAITLVNGSTPSKIVEFNSLLFIGGGRYMYYVDPTTHTATQDKDFGLGKSFSDMAVAFGALTVAMGETEKMYTRSTAGTWTQATDATFAIALGMSDSKLWRAASSYLISNCLSAPLTLTSWNPTSGNEYTAGDSSYAVNTIIDYQGTVWIGKPDGMYAADPTGVFHNQTPQLRQWPHADNCKGAFVAKGSLWCPSAAGLIQITLGKSKVRGPEVTFRPNYRFWVRGGVEWEGQIYLLCTDQSSASPENTCIVVMVPDPKRAGEWVYHEWCRLGDATKGYAITATTKSTVPELYTTHGNNVEYVSLALGGGRDIDDTLHVYGTTSYLETGRIAPAAGENSINPDDLGLLSVAQGVELVCSLRAGDSYTVQGKVDGGAWTNLLDNQESGSGSAPIVGPTTAYQTVIRYFPPASATGHFFEVNWTGTLAAGSGTNRPEIIAAYLFGYLRPIPADMLIISLIMDGTTFANDGLLSGVSAMDMHTLFQNWIKNGTPLTLYIQDYQLNYTTRFVLTYFKLDEIASDIGPGPSRVDSTTKLQAYFVRIPFDPNYGAL